ncbi:hypothetical protein Tco_0191310 [Tanacetum coccineum]
MLKLLGLCHVKDECPKKIVLNVLRNLKTPRQAVREVHGKQLEESDDEIEKFDDDTARYISFTNQAGRGANDAVVLEDENFDCYDGYEE